MHFLKRPFLSKQNPISITSNDNKAQTQLKFLTKENILHICYITGLDGKNKKQM